MSGTKKTTALMRQAGSESGNWNPLPPEHHLYPLLYPEILLNRTDQVLLAWSQQKTVDRFKGEDFSQEQTVQWHDSRGNLKLTHAADDTGLDLSNLSKSAERLEGYGFIWRDAKGFGFLNASGLKVVGSTDGRMKGETEKSTSLYKPLPEYLNAHLKGVSEEARSEFLTGWYAAEQWEDDALAQFKMLAYQRVIARKQALCKKVGTKLKSFGGRGKKKGAGDSRDQEAKAETQGPEPPKKPQIIGQISFLLDPDSDEFVQTSLRERVQTSVKAAYKPEPEFVPGDASLYSSRPSELRRKEELARPGESRECKPTTKRPAQTKATSENPEAHELDTEIELRIRRTRLETLGNPPRTCNAATIAVIRRHLLKLPGTVEMRYVLEVLEDKCGQLAKNPAEARTKTWGWVVGAIKGEVQNILGPEPKDLLQEAVAKKGMR